MIETFYPHQIEAIKKLKSGSILVGDVGSGKSRTAIGYYLAKECHAKFDARGNPLSMKTPIDIYVITTARKRDTLDWEAECSPFMITKDRKLSLGKVQLVVDSWNNIGKYIKVRDAFFIFDEQRVVGSGSWVKSFLKITKANHWILLSATPGDTWLDYVPVFIANGFYRNRTEFISEHVVFSRYSKYPKVDKYLNCSRLKRCRDQIVVTMPFKKETVRHEIDISVAYDADLYRKVLKERKDPETNKPFRNITQVCFSLRKIANANPSRIARLDKIVREHRKVIVFYNFIYELDILKAYAEEARFTYAEWNGEMHEKIPTTSSWLYFVQYTAGAEGWNCIETNTIVFYSQNYSYKIMAQAAGRIDRLNTTFKDLYYYYFRSKAPIDRAIHKALLNKENFNESLFLKA